MEKHWVSFELSEQLKESGWKKETEFWWVKIRGTEFFDYEIISKLEKERQEEANTSLNGINLFTHYPAPLATEILEELPKLIGINRVDYEDTYEVWIGEGDHNIQDKSLPNALAKMWLYLKKEGLIK